MLGELLPPLKTIDGAAALLICSERLLAWTGCLWFLNNGVATKADEGRACSSASRKVQRRVAAVAAAVAATISSQGSGHPPTTD